MFSISKKYTLPLQSIGLKRAHSTVFAAMTKPFGSYPKRIYLGNVPIRSKGKVETTKET